jgi:hypothetical protein
MAFEKEFTLKVSPESKIRFFDSGAPFPDHPYTTFLFIHGNPFNHSDHSRNPISKVLTNITSGIWKQVLDTIPSNTRLLAHSTRGYKPSSLYTPDDASLLQIRARLGTELAAVLTTYITKFSHLTHAQSTIKLLTWPIACRQFNISSPSSLQEQTFPRPKRL